MSKKQPINIPIPSSYEADTRVACNHKAFVKVSSMQIGIDTLGLTVMSIIFKASIFKLKRPFLMT